MASAAVEFNKQSDSSLTSKSTRLRAPIDLVPLNDPLSEKLSDVRVKCSHFSIRGYVSEVRKRDPRFCYPFSLKDPIKPLCTELPPMEVRKFRWWQCISCVPEASCGAGDKEAQKPDENTDTSLPLVEKILKVNVPKERNGEASTSIDSNNNRNYQNNVFADPKGKGKAHVDGEPAIPSACDNGFLKDSTQGFLKQTTDRIEVSQTAGHQVVELGSKCHENGTSKALQKDSREYRVETGLFQESVNHNREYANEICQEKSQDFRHNWLADTPTKVMTAEKAELVNGSRNDCKSRLLNLPDLNLCSGEPLHNENNEAVINSSNNNDVNCEDDDDYLGAERRKNPKIRLLSELLGLKETQISAKGRKKHRSLTSSLDENVKRRKVGSQEDGLKIMEVRALDNGMKKLTRTTESSESDSEYTSDSEDSDDLSTEIISKTLVKRQCKSRIPLLEKRNKKTKIDHDGSSIYRQNIISKSAAPEKGKTSENLPLKSDVPDKLIKRSLVMTKKRGKLCQADKEGNSFNPCKSRVPKDFGSPEGDENAEKIFAQKLQKSSENDVHFPRSLVNCQACVSSVENGSHLPSSPAGLMLIDGNSAINHQEKINNGGETSVTFRPSAIGTLAGDSIDGNGECCIYPKTNMKDKKAGIPDIEAGCSLAQDTHVQAPNLVPNQKEQIKDVRRRIHDIDINSIPIEDEKATDDIPMDIVELMAKNQYERHLSGPKETPCYPAKPHITGKDIRYNGINGSYGEYWPKLRQSPFPTIPRPPSNTDPRNSMVHRNLDYFSDFNPNSLSVASCHPRENTSSGRFYSPIREEHSSRYPPCGATLNSWNENINMEAAQRYPPSFLQAVESYRLRACAPRQNTTEARLWPSMVANRMSLGITNPQFISHNSRVLTKGNFDHHQTSGSILTFSTPGPTSLGKQKNLNFSNGCSNVGGHLESSGGSADMYSNDAVSAMHLLSLMQNAASVQNTASLSLAPPQNVVRPSSSRQPFIEDKGRSSTAMQENFRHPCYPTAIPTTSHFASSFQSNGGNIGRNSNDSGFVGPIPLTLRGQRNMESSHFGLPGGDQRLQRQHMGSSLEKRKDNAVISRLPSANPWQGMNDTGRNFVARGVRCDERTISPISEKMVCKLNQNPSEFNDLKVWPRYMIGPDDLRPRRITHKKSVRPRGDAKRQEVRLKKHNLPDKEREKQRQF